MQSQTPTSLIPPNGCVHDLSLSPAEREARLTRRRLVAERLKQLRGSSPLYQAKAKDDPDYWLRLAASCPNII